MKISEPHKKIVIALVTCARTVTRQRIEKATIENFFEKGSELTATSKLAVFDNASTFNDHWSPSSINVPFRFYQARKNQGLWSALSFLIEDLSDSKTDSPSYLYLVESDHLHDSFELVPKMVEILDQEESIGMFRTEKFNRHQRWKYDKSFSFLPSLLHNAESAVHWHNAVTAERASFSGISGSKEFLKTNLHAKLPGLHRLNSLRQVFRELRYLSEFTEHDFFRTYMKNHQFNGILNGGIWRSSTSIHNHPEDTGSYAKDDSLSRVGYLRTRIANISPYENSDISICDFETVMPS